MSRQLISLGAKGLLTCAWTLVTFFSVQPWLKRPLTLPSWSTPPCMNTWRMVSPEAHYSDCLHTEGVAKIDPKLYEGGTDCEPSANECVTWNSGFIEKVLVMSALAPSKM